MIFINEIFSEYFVFLKERKLLVNFSSFFLLCKANYLVFAFTILCYGVFDHLVDHEGALRDGGLLLRVDGDPQR